MTFTKTVFHSFELKWQQTDADAGSERIYLSLIKKINSHHCNTVKCNAF